MISQGRESPAAAAAAARSQFLQIAANPGLDITTDPYLAAKDWCAMLDTILRSLAREGLPTGLTTAPPVRLNSIITWAPMAHVAGPTLHRWVTIDRWGEEDLSRELHSWRTLGDMIVTKLPMIIHVISIGQTRNGRRASSWARAWKHPTMPSLQMRFKGKMPGAFKGWKPLYFADARVDPDAWVEQMWKEDAAQALVTHISVKMPSPAQCAEVLRDILAESAEMKILVAESTPWCSLPMSRNACDGITPCTFQPVCYGDNVTDINTLGLYRKREAG